jgi:hypothetical protein
MKEQFPDTYLRAIIDEAVTYRCACPAQVAELILKSRSVYDYEQRCLSEEDNLPETHHAISKTVEEAHRLYEKCLDEVLDLEGWDKDNLVMPEGLRKKARLEQD